MPYQYMPMLSVIMHFEFVGDILVSIVKNFMVII